MELSEDTIKFLREIYSTHPDLAFSLIADLLEAQNKTLGHLISYLSLDLGEKATTKLFQILNKNK